MAGYQDRDEIKKVDSSSVLPASAGAEELKEIVAALAPDQTVISSEYVDFPAPETPMNPVEALTLLQGKKGAAPVASFNPFGGASPELRLFEALFGRDSLRAASLLIETHPGIAESTLRELAVLQGKVFDQRREEEPGKIIHEHRIKSDPVRQRLESKGWRFPYYGAVDSTPLFILVLYDYVTKVDPTFILERITDKDNLTRPMSEVLEQCVNQLCRRMDESAGGYLEYMRVNPAGILNQAWKDSDDSYHHKDGTIANHFGPIASVEVQALAYDALLAAATLVETIKGSRSVVSDLRERAKLLRNSVLENFWHEEKEGGYFVMALDRGSDGKTRQLRIKTSNMGHLLDSGLLEGGDHTTQRYRSALIETLFSKEMMSPSGIRTLAASERRFHPCGYHNGNVWPWENAFIARGLRRHAENERAAVLENKIIQNWRVTGLFPEFLVGDAKKPRVNKWIVDCKNSSGEINRVSQPPQPVQLWTVAATLYALKNKRS